MVTTTPSPQNLPPEVAAAVDRWARSVLGAPRPLSPLITQSERKDEVLHRIYTEVVRRDLHSERGPALERQPSPPGVEPAQIDPFLHTPDSLRVASQCVVGCIGCHAAGRVTCPNCRGSGRATCHGCGGAGRVINPSTNRQNKCKVCKASGLVSCSACSGGSVQCPTCLGSGHQRVWLSFKESRQARVAVVPESPTVLAHPQLVAPRRLDPPDVVAFSLHADVTTTGPLKLGELDPAAHPVVQQEWARLDGRLERIAQQQYIQLAVPRQDVTYRMCGADSLLVLSGRTLTGARTSQALRPIRRRLIVWPILVIGLAAFVLPLSRSTIVGHSAYFARALDVAGTLGLVAFVASVPMIGGVLRVWRTSLGLRGLRTVELVASGVWLVALLSTAIVGVAVRPDVSEVDDAVAAGQFDRAHVVLNALREVQHLSEGTLEVEDKLLLAEANFDSGIERLKKLDAVAAHGHSLAAQAAATARADRLASIAEQVEQRRPNDALAAIDQAFADNWRSDSEVAELRALAHEVQGEQCSDDACRLAAARNASAAHSTAARVARAEETRARIVAALATRPAEDLTAAQYVHALTGVSAEAKHTLAQVTGDSELTATATATRDWADQERAKISFLGADAATLAALFPEMQHVREGISSATFEDAEVYFHLSAKGTCIGVYAVGPVMKQRAITTATADRLLSRAVGKTSVVPPQAKPDATSSTERVAGLKVVARWHGDRVVELRIADAAPEAK